jgi:hypothetical protein
MSLILNVLVHPRSIPSSKLLATSRLLKAPVLFLQLAAAEKQQATLRSCGQEESLAAINSLKASYDASLARLHESQGDEVAVLQRRVDRLMSEQSASEAALADVHCELAATKVLTHSLCTALPAMTLCKWLMRVYTSAGACLSPARRHACQHLLSLISTLSISEYSII